MRENLKHYKLICTLFLIIISMLVLLNVRLIKISILNKGKSLQVTNPNSRTIKVYGYSEILDMVSKVPNLYIKNFNNNEENKKLLKVELDYKGDITSFIKVINDFKGKENYVNLENLKIENANKVNQSISFDLVLIKNR
ncbi:hypothetical protein [Candidatus Clostridium stratigraminis]|uniref:Uncharacterized protein n=1 Tax=Candidatus Clostridium stratigraminis TaxID=3381661 RepID=A0ABW8T3L9_9CLOT